MLNVRTKAVRMALTACIVAGTGIVAAAQPAAAATPEFCGWTQLEPVGSSNSEMYMVEFPTSWYDGDSCYLMRGLKGQSSAAVKVVQDAINHCYGKTLNIDLVEDGIFGAATEAAIKKVQKHEKITADGVYGRQTRYNMGWPYDGHRNWVCWEKY